MNQQTQQDGDDPTPHDGTDHHADDASTHDADPVQALEETVGVLLQRGIAGANWFYWVAGLSLVNSAIILGGGNTQFVVGLGVTLVADVMALAAAQQNPEAATMIKGIVIGFDLIVAAIVFGFGFLSRKRFQFVFALGMFLYLLDGLVFVFFQDWLSAGFHGFAVWSMWGGFQAFRRIAQIEQALSAGVDVATN
jgi:hypothetical protein